MAGNFSDRFEILYQNSLASSNATSVTSGVIVYKSNNVITVNSESAIISEGNVFDIRGRLLQNKKGTGQNEINLNVPDSNQVLLLQVKLQDNTVVIRKIVN